MRILMLSWEYPPRNIGGLSNHVYHLSRTLNELGIEVYVITCEEGAAPKEELDNGVHVIRACPYCIENEDFVKWTMHLNFAMVEAGIRLINDLGGFDVIHAHDWIVGYSAKVLSSSFKIPIVTTIHATEHGRNGGIFSDMQRYINSAELLLTSESHRIIVCSEYMEEHVRRVLEVPEGIIKVIPNGVNYSLGHNPGTDVANSTTNQNATQKPNAYKKQLKNNYGAYEDKIVFYIGRHVFEKGIQILIDAIPQILDKFKATKFIIAGTGPMTMELKNKLKTMGEKIASKVIFTEYVDEYEKNNLYMISDVAVFPSLYEPFGIVALEAMAMGCPVVASDVGGLTEIIEHKKTGLRAIPGSSTSLAENIIELLENRQLAMRIANNAREIIKEKYNWELVGIRTVEVYEAVVEENGELRVKS